MKVAVDLTREIVFMHRVDGLPDHSERVHPHTAIVEFTVTGDPIAADGLSPMSHATEAAILRVLYEYEGRDIGMLMGASIPSSAGLAMVLLERTRQLGVHSVEIHEDWASETTRRYRAEV